MNDVEWKDYMDSKFAEIPDDLLSECLEVLPEFIDEDDKQAIIEQYNADPLHWIGQHHHLWGMGCRNFLREKGLKDDRLPDGNWDDYYTQVVERFVGVR